MRLCTVTGINASLKDGGTKNELAVRTMRCRLSKLIAGKWYINEIIKFYASSKVVKSNAVSFHKVDYANHIVRLSDKSEITLNSCGKRSHLM